MHHFRLRHLVLLSTLLLFGAVACEDSEDPNAIVLTFEGTLVNDAEMFHTFDLPVPGTVRLEIADIRAIMLDETIVLESAVPVNLGLGFEADGECTESAIFTIVEGGRRLFNLEPDGYCVSIADGGQFPANTEIEYTLEAEIPQ